MLIVFTTCASREDAQALANTAVAGRLAACVQILPSIKSVYQWKGEVVTEKECLLLFKTDQKTYPRLEGMIKREHSYDVPEIVAVESTSVSESYQAWLSGVLGDK